MNNKYLSIDIGGTNLKYALLDNAGNILEKGKEPTPQEKEGFLKAVDKVVSKYENQIKGLSFCAPGKIDHTTIRFGGALPFLDGIDFAEIYKDLHIPIGVINDGKAGLLAENWLGSLKGETDCAAVILGTGVGGGIMVNGKLLNGVHFQAGELSFMNIDINANEFEGFVGNLGSAVKMITAVNKVLGNEDVKDGLAAFEAINNNESKAVKVFEDYCRRVATIIMNVQSVVDLNKYAIGGGISAQPVVIDGINKAYDKITNDNPIIKLTLTEPKIVAAKFKNDANIYGALYNLLLHENGEKL